jgi:hypothetical protein
MASPEQALSQPERCLTRLRATHFGETVCAYLRFAKTGGEGGIRTLGTVSRTHDFQSCTFDHSVTSPGVQLKRFHASVGSAKGRHKATATVPVNGKSRNARATAGQPALRGGLAARSLALSAPHLGGGRAQIAQNGARRADNKRARIFRPLGEKVTFSGEAGRWLHPSGQKATHTSSG